MDGWMRSGGRNDERGEEGGEEGDRVNHVKFFRSDTQSSIATTEWSGTAGGLTTRVGSRYLIGPCRSEGETTTM